MFSIQELRSSTKKELFQELAKTRKDALKIRVSVKTKHEKDTSKSLKIKRYAAQILTVLEEVRNEESVKKQDAETPKADLIAKPSRKKNK